MEARTSKRSARWLTKMEIEQRQHDHLESMNPDDSDDEDNSGGCTDGDEGCAEIEPDELDGLNTVYRK